jgi:hypothetical protein
MKSNALALILLCSVAALVPTRSPDAAEALLLSGEGIIPTFELFQYEPNSANNKYARLAFSNVRDFPVEVSVTFFQENGTIVYDGSSASDTAPVQSGGKRGFTVEGQQTSYVEHLLSAPTGTPSITFVLPPLKSCSIYMRAGNDFVGGPWPTTHLAQAQNTYGGLFPGFRGFGVIAWKGLSDGLRGPAMVANGSIWSHGEGSEGSELVIHGGLPF